MADRPDLDAMRTMAANWTPNAPGINEQRCWAFTAKLVRQARFAAEMARINNHPNAARKRREADLLEARYGAGETVPKE